MINANLDRLHVVINTHNRLHLIRETIPRIISATKSTSNLKVTHSVYDDKSEDEVRDYLLSLLTCGQIDNLLLGGDDLREFKDLAQTDNPFIANYLQVLRACMFVAPAPWILHFTDDALIRFTGSDSTWLEGWIEAMKSEPRIVAIQMTDYEVNFMGSIESKKIGLPDSANIYRTNFISDRYTLYRFRDLLTVFEDQIIKGIYPLRFEEWLTQYYSVAQPGGRWAIVCQWDEEYIGTHIGPSGAGIEFTKAYVDQLTQRLDHYGPTLTLSERVEFE